MAFKRFVSTCVLELSESAELDAALGTKGGRCRRMKMEKGEIREREMVDKRLIPGAEQGWQLKGVIHPCAASSGLGATASGTSTAHAAFNDNKDGAPLTSYVRSCNSRSRSRLQARFSPPFSPTPSHPSALPTRSPTLATQLPISLRVDVPSAAGSGRRHLLLL
jgi:hypothetical protein